ncbi:hypothetical protein HPB50_001072 [Hyalomma asiaticum]|uniref:Uncharacterized protein n=1 Tax=Hyalomma asiaticum TaxID=266040 RepID=A0ACB7RPY4_HYAAI|nr:hypothetical protein HPB50_001072 [Hyalomma asiaticum]
MLTVVRLKPQLPALATIVSPFGYDNVSAVPTLCRSDRIAAEQRPLDGMPNERHRHFRARWEAARGILDEIGRRLCRTAEKPDPAVAIYRQWTPGASRYRKRSVSEPRSGSNSETSVEESAGLTTSYDGEFKRPYPVSKMLRRPRAPRSAASETTSQSAVVPVATTSTSTQIAGIRNDEPEVIKSISPQLSKLSGYMHARKPDLFRHCDSFERRVLHVRRTITSQPPSMLDRFCSQSHPGLCWLLDHQCAFNELLHFYGIRIADTSPGSFTLSHVDSDATKRANPMSILERARSMRIKPKQFLDERECLVTWLLRVHRCIQRIRLDLTEVAEYPELFCRRVQLPAGYFVVDLNVSGASSFTGHTLFAFLDRVRFLTELSLKGVNLMQPYDKGHLEALITENQHLRKIFFKLCYISDENLAGFIEAAAQLHFLEWVAISLCNPASGIERSKHLSKLFANTRHPWLKRVHLAVACDLKPILEDLATNKSVVEVQIAQKIAANSELVKLSNLAEFNTHLRRLHLSIDFESSLTQGYDNFVLTSFIEKAKFDLLKLENCVFTMRGVKAIAKGLMKGGTQEAPRMSSAGSSNLITNGQPGYLKALQLRGDNLTCEHLNILLEALEANDTLQMLDVGRVESSQSVSHAFVTQKIIDDALRLLQRQTVPPESNPVPSVRVNKVHFADEFQLLISAVRKGVTFRKLNLSFSDVSKEVFDRHSSDFSHLLAVLPLYAVRETLETLEIDVSLPGIHDVSFLGMSLLAATSKNLTELNVTLSDTCSEFCSILLFQGLASSISIRSLTMSGWGLKLPASFWFSQFCSINQTLRKLHIHVTSREDKNNADFIEALPEALENTRWLLDFRLTCGGQREPIFLPEVLSLLEKTQKLSSAAVHLTTRAAAAPENLSRFFDETLTLDMAVTLRRSMDSPEFKQLLAERTIVSADVIDEAIATAKGFISRVLGRRANPHRRVKEDGTSASPKDSHQSAHMDEATQERMFRSTKQHFGKWYCQDINVVQYQMCLSNVSHEMATICNVEKGISSPTFTCLENQQQENP